jgi:hypothetical protein
VPCVQAGVLEADRGDPGRRRHQDRVRGFWSALRPYGRGVYVNFLSDEPAASVRAAYGEDKHRRLVLPKRRYDAMGDGEHLGRRVARHVTRHHFQPR